MNRSSHWVALWLPVLLVSGATAVQAQSVSVALDPVQGANNVVYLRAAPKTSADQPTSVLSLRVAITNTDMKTLTLTGVTFSFQGNPAVADTAIPVNIPFGVGATIVWTNTGGGAATNNQIKLPYPPPPTLNLKLFFTGSPNPVVVTKTMVAETYNYAFPLKHADRKAGEFWRGISAGHAATGAQGSQLFAYDLVVLGVDTVTNNWNNKKQGLTGTKNSDFRAWGTPVYAMADGNVVEFMNNVAENTVVGTTNAGLKGVQNAGNHFYIQHGNVLVLYAHMQPGTLTPGLMVVGKLVHKGDKLGVVGNAGNSSEPHLHVHAMIGTIGSPSGFVQEVTPLQLQALPFTGASMLDFAKVDKTNSKGPWTKVTADGPPTVASAMCYGPNPSPGALANPDGQINAYNAEKASLQAELKVAAPPQKPSLAGQIKAIIAQETKLKKDVAAYNLAHCPIDRLVCNKC